MIVIFGLAVMAAVALLVLNLSAARAAKRRARVRIPHNRQGDRK